MPVSYATPLPSGRKVVPLSGGAQSLIYSMGVATAFMVTSSPKQIDGLAEAEPVKSNPVSTWIT